LGGSSESKSRATGTLSAPATSGWIQEDKHNAQDYCYRRRARLPHLGEPARVRDPSGQWRRQKRRTVRQEEKEERHDGEEDQPRRDRPLRRQEEKEERHDGEEVQPRRDRPLRCQEEKEERHDGEKVRDSLSHRGLNRDFEFRANGRT